MKMTRRNKSMENLRLIPAVILITVMTGSSALAGAPAESGAESALTYLGRELETTAKHLIRTGEDTDDVYTEISWKSVADTFPEKYDLRTRGTVTLVKSQNPDIASVSKNGVCSFFQGMVLPYCV
jgi:hypothetical protein